VGNLTVENGGNTSAETRHGGLTMSIPTKLADDDHPIIRETARRLTQNQESSRDRLRSLCKFVRDDILFGYPAKGDIVKAS